jgi:O-acetyl-ADP-ribose deacetylase (regulator of RNase III)
MFRPLNDCRENVMITIKQGSILDFDGDYIVNPANSFLNHGGGLARIIAEAAMDIPDKKVPEHTYFNAYREAMDWLMEQENHPDIPVGGACLTSAGRLPYRGIIHAVGPIWGGGGLHEADLLFEAHQSALAIAINEGGENVRVAFPAISCGIFGFPVERAAPIALRATHGTDADITFYLYSDEDYEAYNNAVADFEPMEVN